jgi:hypothetical protein
MARDDRDFSLTVLISAMCPRTALVFKHTFTGFVPANVLDPRDRWPVARQPAAELDLAMEPQWSCHRN